LHQVNTVIAIVGIVVVLVGLVSARIETLPVTKPLVALGVGITTGPNLLGWIDPDGWHDPHLILQEAARFTLAISVFGIALRTPTSDFRRLMRPVALLLSLGILVMWAVSAGLAWVWLGLSPVAAVLLGAILTPTDPVVASSIVTGGLAERCLPDRLRAALSLESGANDGLAYLLVLLPILLVEHGWGQTAFWRGLLDTALVGVLLAVITGGAIGYVVAIALHRADKINWVEKHSLLGLSIALSLCVVAVVKLVDSDGILAAFAAGAAFNFGIDRSEEFQEQNVQEAISKLFNLPIFVLLGALLPWRAWMELGWPVLAFAVSVILLRRPVALVCVGPLLGPDFKSKDLAFLGWFGPMGVAALYYALLSQERTHDPTLWHATSLVIVLSVLLHGLTAARGIGAYSSSQE
jgi:NhaP-type Na+/H+ or K+/H+ antiporter